MITQQERPQVPQVLASAQIHTFPFLNFSRFLTTFPSFLPRTYVGLSSCQQILTDLQDPDSLNSWRQQPLTAHTVIPSYSDYFYSSMYLWILILICPIVVIRLKGKWPKEGRSWEAWEDSEIIFGQNEADSDSTKKNPTKAKQNKNTKQTNKEITHTE